MIFLTKLKAVDPNDGELKTWSGPRISAISWGEAKEKIKNRGYLEIDGVLHEEIDHETGVRTKYMSLN